MKIKDLFWKLFWLTLRGKGSTRILFDSEAVCFKAHMIEVTKAYFEPDEGSGLGDYLCLQWDHHKDQYVRISGDIDDIQSIIKHVNEEDENDEYISDEYFAQIKTEAEECKPELDALFNKIEKIKLKQKAEEQNDILDKVVTDIKFESAKYIIDDTVDTLASMLKNANYEPPLEEDAKTILKDVEKF